MKRILLFLLFIVMCATVLSSCQRRCICTYLEDGSRELINNAYTKKDCKTYEDDLKNLGLNMDCDFK